MLSVIITAYKEPETIVKALKVISKQISKKDEIIVVCPDKETEKAAKKFKIRHVKDPGEGKPTALNLVFKEAKGDTLILTDGDVYISKNAIEELTKPLKDKKVGAVSGRPVSLNPRNNFFGYISHLLTDAGAHQERSILSKKNKYLICSGYLMAIKNHLIKEIPKNSLADDAVISNLIFSKGYKIKYTPKAEVYVKYPAKLKDWLKQKRRSAGGYTQIKKLTNSKDQMRSFTKESLGIFRALKYPKNFKEYTWAIILIFLRLYLWLDILINIKLRKKSFSKVWTRIESTK